jgi:hypothetical protein
VSVLVDMVSLDEPVCYDDYVRLCHQEEHLVKLSGLDSSQKEIITDHIITQDQCDRATSEIPSAQRSVTHYRPAITTPPATMATIPGRKAPVGITSPFDGVVVCPAVAV